MTTLSARAMTEGTRPHAAAAPSRANGQYLYGVQGLRTFAALMVAVYHIWFHRVSGGVDVFFVVAGYFAAGSLLKITARPTARARLAGVGQYLLRTARRVFPSAAVVVLGTIIAAALFLPRSGWQNNLGHAVASMTFRENWYLIAQGDDYLQQGLGASAFQQFWALGIQVQSYVVFPLIALIATAVARFVHGSGRRVLLLTSATVAILSFTYSVLLTASNQPTAYFHLGTRLWEFLAGTMLALILVKVRLRPVVASVLGWTGLAVVLGFAAFVDPSPLLPGALALVPVLAAGAVIASARAGAAPRVLTLRPVLWFAESSFAFYLWHWPILVCYQWFVSQNVSWKAGLAILLLAGVLAVATTKLVEQPFRNSPRLLESALATVVACLMLFVPVAAALVVWSTADAVKRDSDWKAVAAVLAGEPVREGEVVPSTTIAAKDLSQAYARNCQQSSRVHIPKPCEWGDPDGELTIALVGGSHDTQWVDAVARTAEGLNARMISITKGSCPFGDVRNSELNPAAACVTWNAAVLDQLIVDPPDLVITTATRTQKGVEEIPEWKTTYLSRLSDAGIEVIGIRDNPRMGRGVLTCLDTSDAAECTVPRSGLLSDHLEVPALEHFTLVDLTDLICDASVCSPVADRVLVTWDGSHLTRTWTLLNSSKLDQAIASVLTGATA